MGDPEIFLPPDLEALRTEAGEAAGAGSAPPDMLTDARRDTLMALPGAVMVGETLDPVGRPAILLGVRTAPDAAAAPRVIDGVTVIVEVIGDVEAQ